MSTVSSPHLETVMLAKYRFMVNSQGFHVLRGKQLLVYENEDDAQKGENVVQIAEVRGFSEDEPNGYIGKKNDFSYVF